MKIEKARTKQRTLITDCPMYFISSKYSVAVGAFRWTKKTIIKRSTKKMAAKIGARQIPRMILPIFERTLLPSFIIRYCFVKLWRLRYTRLNYLQSVFINTMTAILCIIFFICKYLEFCNTS